MGEENTIEQRSKYTFGYASQNSDIFIDNLIKSGFYGLKLVYDLEDKIYFFIAFESEQIKLADGSNTTFDANNPDIRFDGGGKVKKVKFDIEDDDEEQRITISIKNIGEVILVVTYPEYEFLEDIGEDGLEELGVEEGDMIGKIEHLEIEDKYKGQGYAKLLMKKAIEIAKEKGLMPLYLNASPMGSDGLDIDDLTMFYEKLGFQVFFEQGGNNLMILKETYDKGGDIDKLIIGKTYSGKQVRDIVSKYESQEGTDMQGFAISYIKLKDNYILDYVDIQKLIENDIDLKAFISDEYNPNENIEYDKIRQPILLGTNEYSKKQNTVLDGFHRVLQALYNKDKKIVAFTNLEFH
jgi:GNAT superfamily N-acetyltransferase